MFTLVFVEISHFPGKGSHFPQRRQFILGQISATASLTMKGLTSSCIFLAAKQDNETNTTNDYNMTEKKNQGLAKDEAPEVEPCHVQLYHWKSLADRADNVQFVQHISAHLSHMCSLLTAFSTVLRCIPPNFSTQTSTGKMSRPFYMENRFIGESQLYSTCM